MKRVSLDKSPNLRSSNPIWNHSSFWFLAKPQVPGRTISRQCWRNEWICCIYDIWVGPSPNGYGYPASPCGVAGGGGGGVSRQIMSKDLIAWKTPDQFIVRDINGRHFVHHLTLAIGLTTSVHEILENPSGKRWPVTPSRKSSRHRYTVTSRSCWSSSCQQLPTSTIQHPMQQ